MRFREHYGIAKDIAGKEASFFFLMGSLFPDYVERHRIHRTDETLDLIKKRLHRALHTKNKIIKDYLLGTCMHYICDYCCYSHGDKYYEMVHHRIFENAEQAFYCNRPDIRLKCLKNARRFYDKYKPENLSVSDSETFRAKSVKMRIKLDHLLSKRICRIENLHSKEWWIDERIMEIDLYYAYALCYFIYHLF